MSDNQKSTRQQVLRDLAAALNRDVPLLGAIDRVLAAFPGAKTEAAVRQFTELLKQKLQNGRTLAQLDTATKTQLLALISNALPMGDG